MKVVGVIGGIASGKSTVARLLSSMEAGYINADQIGHEVVEIEEIKQQLVNRWSKIINVPLLKSCGSLNRTIVSNIVFNNREELEFLEKLCHPFIRDRIEEKMQYFHPDYNKAVILDAPLLLEAGWHDLCDIILFIDSPIEMRLERASNRNECPLDRIEFRKRESFQLKMGVKKDFSTHIIKNNMTEKELSARVVEFWNHVILNGKS